MPNQEMSSSVSVVVVPFLAQGHLNQLLHLSRIILSYGIPVHYVGTTTHNRQAITRVQGWDPVATSNFHFHNFQIPPFISPPPDPNAMIKFPSHLQPCFDACSHLRHPVSQLLRTLSSQSRKVIVIHDSLMGSVVEEVCSIPNAESYAFHTVSAFTIFFYFWDSMGRPKVDAEMPDEGDIPSLEGCFSDDFLKFISFQHQFLRFNSGRIYNTSKVIEGPYMKLLGETIRGKRHWALGPCNPVKLPDEKNTRRHYCLEWLDKQGKNSVLYVSFGTTTAMDDDQIKELAIGLRKSKQKFVWVLRDADKGDVFNGGEVRRPELPEGYEDSVKDFGLVVRDWAPQLEVLAHPATGGFVSHCGWNSCMESISLGVPIGAWPMHSDQPRNAVLITKLLKVGIAVKDWAKRDEIVTAAMVEDCVKRLMGSKEGEEIRKRAAELGGALRESTAAAEGEICRTEWDSFITHITS